MLCEDENGVNPVECAILSNLGPKFVKDLQIAIGEYNKIKARKEAHKKCMLARRQLFRASSPRAAIAA